MPDMRKKPHLTAFFAASSIVLFFLTLLVIPPGCKKKTEATTAKGQQKEVSGKQKTEGLVFELEEVSVFDANKVPERYALGHFVKCEHKADPNVKYPAFNSDRPIYGSIRVDMEYGEERSGTAFYFAIDESAGTECGYDRLYFDGNCDLDLTNDTPVKLLDNLPDGAILKSPQIKEQVCFNYLRIGADVGTGNKYFVEVMPRLLLFDSGVPSMRFVATKARRGQIEIAGEQYDVLMTNEYPIGTRLDRPPTRLRLTPKGQPDRELNWLGADLLMALHKIKGTSYRFSTTPGGDKLTVQSYDGEFGTFKIGSGGRLVWDKSASGSLFSKDMAVVMRAESEDGEARPVRSCTLPVGNFSPAYLTIHYGSFCVTISTNYHSDGKAQDRGGRPLVYGFTIKKDKPFVLDFSNKPEIIFASPAQDSRFKAGEQIRVEAVLVDPKLDIMVRDLRAKATLETPPSLVWLAVIILIGSAIVWIFSRRLRRRYRLLPLLPAIGAIIIIVGYFAASYTVARLSEYEDVEPQVLITRANGEVVGGGIMPFG
jgi:hypothetical protein